jgi:hypothetical protein
VRAIIVTELQSTEHVFLQVLPPAATSSVDNPRRSSASSAMQSVTAINSFFIGHKLISKGVGGVHAGRRVSVDA